MKTGEDYNNYNSEVGGDSQSDKHSDTDAVSAPGPPTVIILPTIRQKTGRYCRAMMDQPGHHFPLVQKHFYETHYSRT